MGDSVIFGIGAHPLFWSRGLRVLVGLSLLSLAVPRALAGVCDLTPTPGPVSGVYLRSWRGTLRTPTRLAIDANDYLYVTDPLNGSILVRDAEGRVVEELTGLDYPISIAADSAGRLYVGEGNSGRVDVYAKDRSLAVTLGQGDGEFSLPGYLAVHEGTGSTRVFVSDLNLDQVRAYDADTGVLQLTLGGTGSGGGQLIAPSGIAVSGDRIYVVDRGNSRLQVFNVDGTLAQIINPPLDDCGFLCFFEGARRGRARDAGIHVTSDSIIYLAQSSKGRILALNSDGTVLGAVGEFGTAPGQMRVATDVVVDSCGRLIVSAAGNGRLDMFGLPGHQDPERFAAGRLTVITTPLNPAVDQQLVARLELPGHRLAEVQQLLANGIAAPVIQELGDADRDNIPDLTLVFGADLVQSLAGNTQATVTVAGVTGSLEFAQSDDIEIVVTVVDSDGDEVNDDVDACPETASAEVVNAGGCSVTQHCPCDAMRSGEPWGNHGTYVRCVVFETRRFAEQGLIAKRQRFDLVLEALRSRCGARVRRHQHLQ